MTERLIGIDFGTSTTVVHIKNYTDGRPSDGDGTSIQYVEFDGQGWFPLSYKKWKIHIISGMMRNSRRRMKRYTGILK